MKYINESYTQGSSKFIAVDPVDGASVTFSSKRNRFKLEGVMSTAVAFSVKLTQPKEVIPCGETCVAAIQENTLELRGNVHPDTDLLAFKAELDRLYAKALDDYFLQSGVVPNVNADLDAE